MTNDSQDSFPLEASFTADVDGDVNGRITGTIHLEDPTTDPDPEPDDRYEFTGEPLQLRSTAATPAMQYSFLVDDVTDAESLEGADSYETTEDGRVRVQGTIGPRGSDTYHLEGRLADWSAERVDDATPVPQAHYELRVAGDPTGLQTLLGDQYTAIEGYPDPDAPTYWDTVAGFYSEPPDQLTEADCDVTVTTAAALLEEVQVEDQVVWVASDAAIDLSGCADEPIADGVTIAGDRQASEGRDGPLIHVDDNDAKNVFKTQADDLRVTGLRFRGPNVEVLDEYNPDTVRTIGLFYGDNCRFDNLEVYGWPFCGFCAGAKNYPVSHEYAYIHFHHNCMKGLGYGLELFNGFHDIHHCYFDYDRHSIAGFGRPENGFDAHHNVVGPNHLSHAFDMHALRQNVSSEDSWVAGGRTIVRENHFDFTHAISGYPQEAFKIRGIPDDVCEIYENEFQHDTEPTPPTENGDAYHQTNAGDDWANLEAHDNEFGVSRTFHVPELYRPENY